MSDHRPVAIAVTVGTLAIAANAAAAIIAVSATARPEAMGFGIAGLSAAAIGLVLTTLWARRGATLRPRPIFAPQTVPEDDDIREHFPARRIPSLAMPATALRKYDQIENLELRSDSIRTDHALGPALRTAAALPFADPPAKPDGDHVVIYIRDWLAAKR
jgi:hypothetical protein